MGYFKKNKARLLRVAERAAKSIVAALFVLAAVLSVSAAIPNFPVTGFVIIIAILWVAVPATIAILRFYKKMDREEPRNGVPSMNLHDLVQNEGAPEMTTSAEMERFTAAHPAMRSFPIMDKLACWTDILPKPWKKSMQILTFPDGLVMLQAVRMGCIMDVTC